MGQRSRVIEWAANNGDFLPAKKKRFSRAKILDQVVAANASISQYDGHLFRIRSWWMAIAAILIVGFLRNPTSNQINVIDLSDKSPQFSFFILSIIGLSFWSLDAMNKSLQLVLIHMARDLENAIFFDIPIWSPSKSRRFKMREGRHAWRILKNLTEQSLAPFYLLPILGGGLIFWVEHILEARVLGNRTSYKFPDFFSLEGLGMWTLLGLAILIVTSFYLRRGFSWIDKLAAVHFQKPRKRRLKKLLENDWYQNYRFDRVKGMQFHRLGGDVVLFLDYGKTWKHRSYIVDRARVAKRFGLRTFSLNLQTLELADFENASTTPPRKYNPFPSDLSLWKTIISETSLPPPDGQSSG